MKLESWHRDQVSDVVPGNNWVMGHRDVESRVRTLRVQKLGLGRTRAGNLGGRHSESMRLKIGSKSGGWVGSVWSAGRMWSSEGLALDWVRHLGTL